MRPGCPALERLADAIDHHLSGVSGEAAAIAEVRGALARFRAAAPDRTLAAGSSSPQCGHLDVALALAARQSSATLLADLRAALPFLTWITYNAYPADEIGPLFPAQHAFASLAAPYDAAYDLDFDLGILLIAPHTLYRDHRHQAAELYLPLTGPTRWRFGIDAAWETRAAGEPVWNPPQNLHATLVGEVPLLCLYAWTRDVQLPAELVPAPDWLAIEADLVAQAS